MPQQYSIKNVLGLILLVLWLPVLAQTTSLRNFTVRIEGAGALGPLLNDNLEVVKRSQGVALAEEEIRRLADIAPEQIRELLATEGYFSPQVTHVLNQDANPWIAVYTIAPGTPTRIESVDIRFKGGLAAGPHADEQRMQRLRRRWSLDPGDVFRQAAWDASKSALLKDLLVNEYPAAAITDSEARIDPKTRQAVLTIELDSGPRFTFGELQIEGLQRYSRSMVEQLNPIHPGEPYSQDKLNDLQARAQDSGYFRSAFATVEVNPAHPDRVPVRLDLTENERKRLALGLGFSTDTGARGSVKWLDRNFLGRQWRLESELRIDRETRVIGGDVFLPAIAAGKWLPGFGAHFERTDSSGETNDKLRTNIHIGSANKADEKIWTVAYLSDRQRIGDNFKNNREALIASFGYTKRRVDNLLSPNRGYVASIELGVGPRGVINAENLLRIAGRGTWLSPTRKRFQAVLRGQIGQVIGAGRESVPADLLFRTGGDQSVRGYAYNSLGVMQDGAIVGGTVSAVLSAELVYRLTPQWGAAVFTDAGNAADSWKDFRFKLGSGVGARWRSPIGPVNLDLAYGHSTHKPRLHFSIGYGF